MSQQAPSRAAGRGPMLVHPDGEALTVEIPPENKIPDVVRVACRFAGARGRPAAVYLLAEGNPAEDRHDVPITKKTVTQLASALGDDQFHNLDLVIQSSGGDIHAAYQMMSLLRSRMSGSGELVACVPGKAQSSATLLCLGADKILLGELGALGPLDAQIKVGVTDAGTPDYISALHLLKGLNRLQRFSLETFDEAAIRLCDHDVSRKEDLLKYSIEFSRAITAPLFERIESQNIGSWDQMLLTGEAYGRRLLKHGKLIKDHTELNREEHIAQVLHHLVFEYPSHEAVIDCDELVNGLDLQAELMEPRLRPFAHEFATCNSETLIALVYPPDTKSPIKTTNGMSIADWKSLETDGSAREVSWKNSGQRFSIRVGLYRQKIAWRNPWRETARRAAQGGPATQYAVDEGQPRGSW
jgi:Serine dehydrogenase proteinase